MIEWHSFNDGNQSYDLSHLAPRWHAFEQAAKEGRPARIYNVRVGYSCHCFTRGMQMGETSNHPLVFRDRREERIFDSRRYEKSKALPQIIDELPRSKCFHTGHGTFFVVKRLNDVTGESEDYEVYFDPILARGVLELHVRSAFVRDRYHQNRPKAKPIGFLVILFNRSNNREIKPAP